ncbi:LGFP repeat-containing protein [Nocardia arizonensis]|uniref:LGFP repeat-containing protein n=1 Tax=Nocardia arizonensis TaxID=1141647 RepID=UPI0006D0D29A|nr:esterase [Nocardia arizonensis]
MHHFARRTAGYSTALLTAALLVTAGCGDNDDNDSNAASNTASAAETESASMKMAPAASGTTSAPVSATEETHAGTATETTRIATQGGAEVTVSGDIYDKYAATEGPTGMLGVPLGAEQVGPGGGKYQDFVGGTIYQAPDGDPHIVWGEIRTAWEDNGGANGKLGYPTSDETDIPGGKQSTFTGGTITWVDGQITVTPTS